MKEYLRVDFLEHLDSSLRVHDSFMVNRNCSGISPIYCRMYLISSVLFDSSSAQRSHLCTAATLMNVPGGSLSLTLTNLRTKAVLVRGGCLALFNCLQVHIVRLRTRELSRI